MRTGSNAILALAGVLVAGTSLAHHPIGAKFDETKSLSLTGVVTLVDWRNPHVHVFVNVATAEEGVMNWAVELPSPVTLEQSGWTAESLRPGDAIAAEGIAARDGTRQIWGETLVQSATGRKVLYATARNATPPREPRPAPRWPDGTPRLSGDASGGFWAYPSATVLVENGVTVAIDADGLLRNVADAPKVAPLQPWALALYTSTATPGAAATTRCSCNCKPPGGPRQFRVPFGVQFLEDRERQRIFVLIGSGNNNFRIIYMDGREQGGQVGGDDDNPLYYGRSVGQWEGDTLVADTRGFNEDFWFTNGGLPHTDRLRLDRALLAHRPRHAEVRGHHRRSGRLHAPWSSGWTLRWVGGEEMPRHLCQDNRP